MAFIYSNENWELQNNKAISKGEGFYLKDPDANKYLDGIANMWCYAWRHQQNEGSNAMIVQKKLGNTTFFGLANEHSINLVEELITYYFIKEMAKLNTKFI